MGGNLVVRWRYEWSRWNRDSILIIPSCSVWLVFKGYEWESSSTMALRMIPMTAWYPAVVCDSLGMTSGNLVVWWRYEWSRWHRDSLDTHHTQRLLCALALAVEGAGASGPVLSRPCTAICRVKRAIISIQRAIISIQRAIISIKRALYTLQK